MKTNTRKSLQLIQLFIASSIAIIMTVSLLVVSRVTAEVCVNGMEVPSCSSVGQCPQSNPNCHDTGNNDQPTVEPLEHVGLNDGGTDQDKCEAGEGEELNEDNCTIVKYLLNGINFLSAMVGIAATFSIIWAGYQYIMSRDNPQAISAAKNRIITTIIALLLYLFMWVILQYLVPGGVL